MKSGQRKNTSIRVENGVIYKLKFPDKHQQLVLRNISSKLPHMEINFLNLESSNGGVKY